MLVIFLSMEYNLRKDNKKCDYLVGIVANRILITINLLNDQAKNYTFVLLFDFFTTGNKARKCLNR